MLAVFLPIRQFVRGDWIVTNHLLTMVQRLTAMPDLADAKPLLEKVAVMITEDVESGPMVESEKRALLK